MNISFYLEQYGIEYEKDLSTARLSSIKAGGYANYVLYPRNSEELITSIKLSNNFFGKFKLIGGCTNTFFSDADFSGTIICTKKFNRIAFNDCSAALDCGASLSGSIKAAANRGIDIGSGLFGIPGTIGGGVRNNAGAYESSVSDTFLRGEFYDRERDSIITLDARDLNFSYRYSSLQSESLILLNGIFRASEREKEALLKELTQTQEKRRSSHPTEPSLGSFFKRSDNIVPAALIENAGLKCKRIGGAQISPKHSGFIINAGNATAEDINALAEEVEATILKSYGVRLEREAEFVK